MKTDLAPYVRSFFEDHLTCRRNMSYNTIQSYRDSLKLLLQYAAQATKKCPTRLQMTDITPEMILGFLADLEQSRNNSTQTRNHRLVAIRGLFEYIAGCDPRYLDHAQKIKTIPRKRGATIPEIHYLEKGEITAILQGISTDVPLGRRDYCLLLYMYNTGARVQEVADTLVGWLTLHPPCKVEILGKGRKWRTCPLWENTSRHLQALIEERGLSSTKDGHLFVNRVGRPFSRAGIANIISRHVRRAAAASPALATRKVTPHTIRHTTAMHLLQSGVEVNVIRSWLGHVSISTTSRYIEIDLAMKAKALEACQPADGTSVASWRSQPDILAWLESL